MAYDGKVMQRAMARFTADRERRREAFLGRQAVIFRREPRIEEISRELRGTMAQVIAVALRRGEDPVPAIAAIREENLALQRERSALLGELGYPPDALTEKPNCPLCDDTGFRGAQMCRCLRRYYADEQIRELSRLLDMGQASFSRFDFTWYDTAVWPELGISPRENMEKNYDICQDYAHQFSPRSGNLLLSGDPGLGKTFLSACIARVVSENGFSVVYDTATRVFAQFEAEKFRRGEEDEATADVDRYSRCDLLILDDLGTEMTTAFVQSVLYQLINGRLVAGKKTVISTNLNPEEIGRRYSPQILSRIEGEYQILPFFGEDIRRLKREREG